MIVHRYLLEYQGERFFAPTVVHFDTRPDTARSLPSWGERPFTPPA